jgi:tRNA 2-thiouridine synthesizing protein A
MKFDALVDARGLKCPLPLLHCKRGLNSLESGQILKIHTTDKNASKDLEAFCENTGHEINSSETLNQITTFYIKKN